MSYLDNTGLAYFWQKIKTILYSANNPPPYPVTRVNGQTGAVSVPTVAVQDSAPSDANCKLWIDTDEPGASVTIPQIDDDNVSEDDTWSSQKIAEAIAGANESSAGYCKMPDGTLIQWGNAGGGGASGTSKTFPVTFEIPFANTPCISFSTYNDSAGHYDNISTSYVNLSGSGFTVRLSRPSSGYIGAVVRWIAIGRWK